MIIKRNMNDFIENVSKFMMSILVALILASVAHAENYKNDIAGEKEGIPSKVMSAYGEWVPPDGDAIIKVQACDNHSRNLCAYLVRHAYENLSESDALNPDQRLRERSLIGIEILNHVKFSKINQWRGGDLYDPRTGKSYFAKVRLLNQNQLKITGCIGPGLCKGYIWRRASEKTVLREGTIFNKPSVGSE